MSETPDTELPSHGNDSFRTRCAMLVSILAMCLAIASLGGNNASKESMSNNILAANAYAFYQAKNIRQTDYKIAADELRIQLANEKLNSAAKEIAEKNLKHMKRILPAMSLSPKQVMEKRVNGASKRA